MFVQRLDLPRRCRTRDSGIGEVLLQKTVRYCREREVREVCGYVRPNDRPMLEVAEGAGFQTIDNAAKNPAQFLLDLRTTPRNH